MRTTVRLDENLLAEAKALAARRGTTLTALVEESLRERVRRAGERRQGSTPELPVSKHDGGVMPGVDLDDNAATRELLDADRSLEQQR